jgi:CDP-glucose 4,6-dehydratase
VVERLRERWPEELEVTTAPEGDDREAAVLRVDSTRARERLAWEPAWDLSAGIDATIDWYLAHRDRRDMPEITSKQITRFTEST